MSLAAPVPTPLLLPLLVFLAEMCVVTLGTIRIIFVSRGMKVLAPILGFFEICIWLFAIGQIMKNLSNLGCYLAFAAGFTLGNFLGVLIEKRLAIGTLVVHIITHRDASALIRRLRLAEYGVTSIDGQGGTGPVKIVLTVIKRKELAKVVAIIEAFDPKAFYSVDEIQSAAAGVFPATKGRWKEVVPEPLRRVHASNRVTGPNLLAARPEDSQPAVRPSPTTTQA
ncbi:MAG: DUF2179 domain-containing protein [Gemmataceae bacterium]|nr:DUF2179 domain-containing protein [Gemmataceae bacterium]